MRFLLMTEKGEFLLADGQIARVNDLRDDVDTILKFEIDEVRLAVFDFVNRWLFGMGAEQIRVKSFTYRKSSFGIYRRQELLDLRKIDDHIAQILSDGWEILAQTAHSCERILLRPFSKPDTVTFRKN